MEIQQVGMKFGVQGDGALWGFSQNVLVLIVSHQSLKILRMLFRSLKILYVSPRNGLVQNASILSVVSAAVLGGLVLWAVILWVEVSRSEQAQQRQELGVEEKHELPW